MSFSFHSAQEIDSLERIRMLGSAMRKTGRPVVLVPLHDDVHVGHISLIRAATLIPRAVVVVAFSGDEVPEDFARERVDVVWRVTDTDLWRSGSPAMIAQPAGSIVPLEPAAETAAELTRLIALIGALGPSDIIVGEKDYELTVMVRRALADFHLGVTLHGVPTVRMPGGLAMSLRNTRVAEGNRDKAMGLSAALTAGAHAAEQGGEAVVRVAQSVLDAAGITPEYLELRGLDFTTPPERGDARLLVAAEIGGVRLIDNVGVPIGIGFKNLTDS